VRSRRGRPRLRRTMWNLVALALLAIIVFPV
jgi:hypothetical protein